jgi:predicted PurR-regulated permease PerM
VIFYVLYIGKNIILPLIISIFLIILFTSSYRFFFSHIKNKFFSVLITLLAFSLFFLLVFFIINSQINNFIEEIPRYKDVFLKFAKYINTIP